MLSVQQWDESRNAYNLIEMNGNGKLLVRYFEGKPDEWETKPPLLIWAQLACAKVLGINELSIRLPSAFAALGLALGLIAFFRRSFQQTWMGMLVALVLVSTEGYIRIHVTRTGDHDSLLIAWMMGFLLCYFRFLEEDAQRSRNILLAMLFLTLGILTKSIVPMIFLPGVFIYTLIRRKLRFVLLYPAFWGGIGLLLLGVGSYYAAHEYLTPGYLKIIWENELFPRYFNTATKYTYDKHPFDWFLKLFYTMQYRYWLTLLPLALGLPIVVFRGKMRLFALFFVIQSFVFYCLISAGTANDWYIAPIFPMLAICMGMTLYWLIEQVIAAAATLTHPWKIWAAQWIICLAVLAVPYKSVLDQTLHPKDEAWEHQYGYVIRRLPRVAPEIREFKVLVNGFLPSLSYYCRLFSDNYGYKITTTGNWEELQVGEYVLVAGEDGKNLLNDHFATELRFEANQGFLYKVLAKR